MLKSIAQPSPDLQAFIQSSGHPLNQAQERHITQVADALVTIDGRKTLSSLYRAISGDPCPKAGADTFRVAPWQADDLRIPLREKLVQDALIQREAAHQKPIIFLSLDDGLTDKDKGSKRLQAVDWHFDHVNALPNHPAFTKGCVYVMLRLTVGEVSFTIDMQLYLRASTVRRLNKEREPGKRLTFHSKIDIAQQMLEAVAPFIPPHYRVYVLFDSWYAAASLLKWCRAQDWHIICRLKSNRLLNGEQVRYHNQRLKHRRYTRVRVTAADEERPKTYLVRSLTGQLSSLPDDVRVFISKRHNRDTRPRYFCSTDLSLSAHQALSRYHERWGCDVANWYIAEKLGWADCRLWHVESVEKYLVVLWLALAYIEVRKASSYAHHNLADVIRLHRQEHARALLEEACQLVLQTHDLQQVYRRYSLAAA
jgi:hypothetical protein